MTTTIDQPSSATPAGDSVAPTSASGTTAPPASRNEVVLVGRLSDAAEDRALPSGDVVTTWRLVVTRPPLPAKEKAARPSAPKIDTIDCSTFAARIRRRSGSWAPGSWLQVHGALRRRFWQTPGGPQSRYEVEADDVRVLAKPG